LYQILEATCICTETAAVDGAVNKQLNAAQQIATGLTLAHKVLIKKQVKKELAKAKQAPPTPTDELHEHLNVLHKAITAGHNEVVRALHEIAQAADPSCLRNLGSESQVSIPAKP